MTQAPWYDTREIAPGLWQTNEPHVHDFFSANAFTLRGRDADLQVDFGCGLAPLRQALRLTGKPVIGIATHCHIDHVGSFHEFDERLGHANEADTFASMADDLTFQHLFRTNAFGASISALPSPGFRLKDWSLRPAPLTQTLTDGDRIDLGDRTFTVLHLPGHSPGSIGLLDERDGLFFTGDAVYDDRLVDDIPGASVPDYLRTFARLKDLEFRVAHGGHGPSFTKARLAAIASDYFETRG